MRTLHQSPWGGELSLNANFFISSGGALKTPKVPVYAVRIPLLQNGDLLEVDCEFIIDIRTSGFMKPAFSASCVLLLDFDPAGMVDVPLVGKYIAAANGEDVYAANPYRKHTRVGKYLATADDAGDRWVAAITWIFSDDALRWDYANIVNGYGRLNVCRNTQG